MNNKRFVLNFILVIFTAALSNNIAAVTNNSLLNSGFEDGVKAPWSGMGSVVNTNMRSGNYAIKLPGIVTSWPSLHQSISVVAGNTYEFRGWLKVNNITTGRYVLEARWYASDSSMIANSKVIFGSLSSSTEYTEFVQEIVAPAQAVNAKIFLQANKADGQAYYDALSIVDVTNEAPNDTQLEIRVNAGGDEYIDGDNNVWLTDVGWNTGTAGAPFKTISGTSDQPLFDNNRYNVDPDPKLEYSFEVLNGNYTVRLHFAETYDPVKVSGGRVFNVDMEGTRKWTDLDVFTEAGSGNTALVKETFVTVNDGQLNIEFLHGSASNPIISAIEILTTIPENEGTPGNAETEIRVNAGGNEYIDGENNVWLADIGWNTGTMGAPFKTITGTLDQPLFDNNRYNLDPDPKLEYSFEVLNGNYTVRLYFAETYDPAKVSGGRVFNISMEGTRKWTDLDVFTEAGSGNTALVKETLVTVNDGQLNIEFLHGSASNPIVSAIEVLQAPPESDSVTYYVKSDGTDPTDPNDCSGGTSDATAWKTTWSVNRCVSGTSDDVYFKAGDIFSGQELLVDWGGTASDRVIIGSYYMSGGDETVGVPVGTEKPQIKGGYVDNTSIGNSPRNNTYRGLITAMNSDYVTVQNMSIQDSSGYGVTFSGSPHGILENTEMDHITGGFTLFSNGSDYGIVRNNTMSRCVWSHHDGIKPVEYGSHPPCAGAQASDYMLFENNLLVDLYGEAISTNKGGLNTIIADNVLVNTKYSTLFVNGASGAVIERNMVIGNIPTSNPNWTDGVSISVERNSKEWDAHDIIIRNNFFSGVNTCFYLDMFPIAIDLNRTITGKFIGNTCVGAAQAVRVHKTLYQYPDIEIANNIFWDIENGAAGCSSPTSANFNYHHNSWDTTPSDSDCRGTGDVSGDPTLFNSSDFRDFGRNNMPSAIDFEPKPGSNAENAGDPMLTTVLSLIDYPQSTATPLRLKKLEYDYRDTLRHAITPDMGALEIN